MPIPDAAPTAIHAPSPIVITGRALPAPRSDKAFNVEQLTRDQLVDAPSARLDAVLKQVAGLQLFRRSDSTSGHPTSQGVTLRALGGTASSRALLILDGVPQSDPFGGWINWPAYDPASLAEVRVIRGGGSVANGPGALAGVIEMSSLADEGARGSVEAGSRESVDGHLYLGHAAGSSLLTLSAQAGSSSGFVPLTANTRGPVDRPAPYAEMSGRARWIVPLGSDVDLQLGALGFVDRRERGLPFTDNRTRGGDASLRLVGNGRWKWSANAYAQARNLRSSFASVNDDRTAAQRVSLQYSVPSDAFGGGFEVRPPLGSAIELRLGADARLTRGQSKELYAYSGGVPARRRVSGGTGQTEGLFTDGSLNLGRLTLSGGARLDHWRIADGKLVERLIATDALTRDDHFPARDGWRPTGRIGAVVDVTNALSVRSAAYLGWRLPTLNELFRPFRAGPDATAANPLLDPERLRGAEVGADFRRGPSSLSLTAFANRLDDAIANLTLGHGPGQFPGVGFVAGAYRQRKNVGSIVARGIELSAASSRGPWSLRIDASFTDARMRTHGLAAALDGLRPAQTPRFAVSATVGWKKGGNSLALSADYVGAQYDDDLNLRRLPPATTIGAFGSIGLSSRIELLGRVENLFDERVIAGRADDGSEERATPRTLWLGLRLRGR